MTRSKLIFALAALTVATQLVSVDAFAQRSTRQRCIEKGRSTTNGAIIGAILGTGAGILLGETTGDRKAEAGEIIGGAAAGGVIGGAVEHGRASDACREVEMDRRDREESRGDGYGDDYGPARGGGDDYAPARGGYDDYAPARGGHRGPRGHVRVVSRYELDMSFMRFYARAYADQQRIAMISDLSRELSSRGELIDGYSLYQILVRIDGGRGGRVTANRVEALSMLVDDVARLNYQEQAWIDGLFNRNHPLYREARRMIRRISM